MLCNGYAGSYTKLYIYYLNLTFTPISIFIYIVTILDLLGLLTIDTFSPVPANEQILHKVFYLYL